MADMETLINEVKSLGEAFAQPEGGDVVDELYSKVREVRQAALQHDDDNGGHAQAEALVPVLQRMFASAMRAREQEKKTIALNLVTEMFRCYFAMNNLRLCQNLIKSVEKQCAPVETFNKEDAVTYWYYAGRLALFDAKFGQAEEFLSLAANSCHRRSKNLRTILLYLVPVRMLRGTLPKAAFLDRYKMTAFKGIVQAIRTGDMRPLNQAMQTYQSFFIQSGIFLLLERLRPLVFRTLVTKVAKLSGTHQVKMAQINIAAKLSDASNDADEDECLVANLIYQGLIRGYVSHGKQILVIAKEGPFPKPSSILKKAQQ
eukprot:TRINITY_DN4382_c0_g1_i1.p1 TRINITY_DN4382_c0_g1~~TRINITY_DN4382_c0_g1_i1.p1  ORF type:complete len:316 (+),score=63.34 TRINITY_DN4382_c0_g1_i1:44-991(+)